MNNQEKQQLMETLNNLPAPTAEDFAEYSRLHDAFLDQHDFNDNPSRMARTVTAYARKEILLYIWNQFVACEEAQAEFMGLQPKGKGWKELGEMRRIDQVNAFRYFFNATLDGILESMEKDETKSDN